MKQYWSVKENSFLYKNKQTMQQQQQQQQQCKKATAAYLCDTIL